MSVEEQNIDKIVSIIRDDFRNKKGYSKKNINHGECVVLCEHAKLNGIRNRGSIIEYRECARCKKKIYKYSKVKIELAKLKIHLSVYIDFYRKSLTTE